MGANSFNDHFSGHSREYRAFRPDYPNHYFAHLASLCTRRDLAWDCATGSGQAAAGLSRFFAQVIATDASANQLASAPEIAGVSYRVALAEQSGLDSGTVDLVSVAQALHWFDIEAFGREARRVLKPGGVLAVSTYGLLGFDTALDEIIARFNDEIVADYWPFDRSLVETAYAGVEMPLEPIEVPPMAMTLRWRFADLIGYFDTWTAVREYRRINGSDPLELVRPALRDAWGNPHEAREATWPLAIRAWRKPAA